MISIIVFEQYVLFYYNTIRIPEQVFSFFIYKILLSIYAQIHNSSPTCRGRRILAIYYVKFHFIPPNKNLPVPRKIPVLLSLYIMFHITKTNDIYERSSNSIYTGSWSE